jgi:hypothetical protein
MRLSVNNFRVLRDETIDFAPITILYGRNGAGKSSLIYALLTLREIITNPAQSLDALFNYGFINLGSFANVVSDHASGSQMTFVLSLTPKDLGRDSPHAEALQDYSSASLAVILTENAELTLLLVLIDRSDHALASLTVRTTLPYSLGQIETASGTFPGVGPVSIEWNGVTAKVATEVPNVDMLRLTELQTFINFPSTVLAHVRAVPLRRGFTRPQYSLTPMSPNPRTEDEIATLIANDRYLQGRISSYLERIIGRDFRVDTTPGSPFFSLDTLQRESGLLTEVVNEGYGLNQLVDLLALSLTTQNAVVSVEEPEIHLHPTAVRRLSLAFLEIARTQKKVFLISTHSEAMIVALLAAVAQGNAAPDDIAIYYVNDSGGTRFERQSIDSSGQLRGGLRSFMEAEMEDVTAFLSPRKGELEAGLS